MEFKIVERYYAVTLKTVTTLQTKQFFKKIR